MSIKDRFKVVQLAEIECQQHSENARAAWKDLKKNFRHAATPWRIVTVGVLSGFLMGRSAGGGSGESVGAKLFGTVAQALITTLGASATAGMAATSAADAAASATVDAVEAETKPADVRIAEAKKEHEPATTDT